MEEKELIAAAKKGDLDAFNTLVLTYQGQAYNVALRILSDESLAEDATQDAFISAYQNIRGFRGGSLRAWILRIVTNCCYDELRRRKRRPSQPIEVLDPESGEEVDDPDVLSDKRDLPEDVLAQKELGLAVQNCIEGLPTEFRAVLVLVDIQGLDYLEACQIIHKPIGTLKSRLARARVRIQDCLQGAWELLPREYRLKEDGKL